MRLAGRHPPALAGSKHEAGRHCGAKYFWGIKWICHVLRWLSVKTSCMFYGQARIAVVGLGGVGSYVAESLCRSGVGHLLLIDADKVAASNINRQLPALTSTFGRFKTEVVRQRLLDINPDCEIETVSKFYEPGAFCRVFFLAALLLSPMRSIRRRQRSIFY